MYMFVYTITFNEGPFPICHRRPLSNRLSPLSVCRYCRGLAGSRHVSVVVLQSVVGLMEILAVLFTWHLSLSCYDLTFICWNFLNPHKHISQTYYLGHMLCLTISDPPPRFQGVSFKSMLKWTMERGRADSARVHQSILYHSLWSMFLSFPFMMILIQSG